MHWWKAWRWRVEGELRGISPAVRMSRARLHADDAFTTTVRALISDVGILLARVLMAFQNALSTVITFAGVQCRSGGACGLRLALFGHGKSFRGYEDNPPERRFVP
jgi:hypothetical protein